jgi:hypothetical protein
VRSIDMMLARAAAICVILCGAATAETKKEWPQYVTQAWLGELGRGKWHLAPLVDAGQGLVVIHHEVDSPREDSTPIVSSERLCGKKLDAAIGALEKTVVAGIKSADTVACRNRPAPAYCTFEVANEYTTMKILVFRADDAGKLALDAVLFVDGGSGKDAWAQQRSYARAELTKARSTDCDGKPAKPPSYAHLSEERD